MAFVPEEEPIPHHLNRILKGEVPPDELKKWLAARYEVSHFFAPMLARTIAGLKEKHPEKEKLITTLEANLREELGEGNQDYTASPHAQARENLLAALGLPSERSKNLGDLDNLGELDPRTQKWVTNSMLPLLRFSPLAAATGISYWESRVGNPHGDWPILLKGLERAFPDLKRENYTPSDALWHVASHANVDFRHGQELEAALLTEAKLDEISQLSTGQLVIKRAFDTFWGKDEIPRTQR